MIPEICNRVICNWEIEKLSLKILLDDERRGMSEAGSYRWLGEGRGAAPAAPIRLRRSLACTASGLLGKREIRLRSSFTPASRWLSSSRAKPFLSWAAAALFPPGYWSRTLL